MDARETFTVQNESSSTFRVKNVTVPDFKKVQFLYPVLENKVENNY